MSPFLVVVGIQEPSKVHGSKSTKATLQLESSTTSRTRRVSDLGCRGLGVVVLGDRCPVVVATTLTNAAKFGATAPRLHQLLAAWWRLQSHKVFCPSRELGFRVWGFRV